MGDEAEDFAKRVLDNWQNENFRIVVRCLHILSTSEQAERIFSSILNNKTGKKLYYAVFKFPLHHIPSWWQSTVKILQNWEKNTALTVAKILRHYLADKQFLKEPCRQILKKWRNAIDYQRKKDLQQIYTDHILIALGHPHLRTIAARTAAGMLLHEKEQPGFLGEKLLQAAEAIVSKGEYPSWDAEPPEDMPQQDDAV